MIVSRGVKATSRIAVAILTTVLSTGAAQAQGAGPLTLIPGFGANQSGQAEAAPAPRGAPDALLTPAAPDVLSGGAIAVQPLEQVNLTAVGVLDPAEAGLPRNLWAGTPSRLAATLVTKLPVGALSPVMHDLMTRLLAVNGGAPEPAGGATAGPDLLAARVDALRRLGAFDLALKLADAAPDAARTEAVLRARLDVMLSQVSADPAAPLPEPLCRAAREGLAAFDGPYWQKVAAVCDLATGRVAEAQVAIAMLRETGHEDPAFSYLADRMMNLTPAAMDTLPAPEPLTLAMMRRTASRCRMMPCLPPMRRGSPLPWRPAGREMSVSALSPPRRPPPRVRWMRRRWRRSMQRPISPCRK